MTLRLHLNENAAGCSPAVIAAIRSISSDDLSRYPDTDEATTRAAGYFGVDPACVLLTNGLDEGLLIAALAASAGDLSGGQPAEAVVAEPAFEVYAQAAAAARLRIVSVPPSATLAFPLDAAIDVITERTRLVFVTDPNNPTGLRAPDDAVERLGLAAPRGRVLVDEAYAEFSGRSSIAATTRLANVVVGRTFAKAHGLAGVRAGALVACPDQIEQLRPFALPFRMNVVALRALVAALDDESHVRQAVLDARESRDAICAWAQRTGLEYWPSVANFVLVRVGPAATAIAADLARRGVLVRDKSRTPGCGGCLRITAGRPAETRAALDLLEVALAARAR